MRMLMFYAGPIYGFPARHFLRRPPPDGGCGQVPREGVPSPIYYESIPYLDKTIINFAAHTIIFPSP